MKLLTSFIKVEAFSRFQTYFCGTSILHCVLLDNIRLLSTCYLSSCSEVSCSNFQKTKLTSFLRSLFAYRTPSMQLHSFWFSSIFPLEFLPSPKEWTQAFFDAYHMSLSLSRSFKQNTTAWKPPKTQSRSLRSKHLSGCLPAHF